MEKREIVGMYPTNKCSREEILRKVRENPELQHIYDSLDMAFRQKFLDFCLGMKGLPLTYDPFFKRIFHPELHPERLSRFLSLILGMKVTVKQALMNESSRIMEEGSLLVMDIVVELEDGSIANVEIQKVPYRFPGPRASCYSSDLVMRQYSRAKKDNEKFSYKTLKKVYTIVLLERSEGSFHEFPENYLHRFEQKSDSGLKLDLLQEYVFIALDMFHKIKQNKIEEELDAWLYCIASEDPEVIQRILERYPQFWEIYREVEAFRRDIGGVLSMFSEALKIMDRNTVQYMIDELEGNLAEAEGWLAETKRQLNETKGQLSEATEELNETKGQLSETAEELNETRGQLSEATEELNEARGQLSEATEELNETRGQLSETAEELNETKTKLMEKELKLQELEKRLAEMEK